MCASKDLRAPGSTRATLPGPALPPDPRGPERQRRPSQAWGPSAKAQGGSGSAAPEAVGTGLSFLLLRRGRWGKPLHWPGHLSGLCRARTAPLQLWEGSTSPTRDPHSCSSPWAHLRSHGPVPPLGLPAQPLLRGPSVLPTLGTGPPLLPEPGLTGALSSHTCTPAIPWHLPSLPGAFWDSSQAQDRVPLMEAVWAQGPGWGGPTGPTRRVLGFAQDQK